MPKQHKYGYSSSTFAPRTKQDQDSNRDDIAELELDVQEGDEGEAAPGGDADRDAEDD